MNKTHTERERQRDRERKVRDKEKSRRACIERGTEREGRKERVGSLLF